MIIKRVELNPTPPHHDLISPHLTSTHPTPLHSRTHSLTPHTHSLVFKSSAHSHHSLSRSLNHSSLNQALHTPQNQSLTTHICTQTTHSKYTDPIMYTYYERQRDRKQLLHFNIRHNYSFCPSFLTTHLVGSNGRFKPRLCTEAMRLSRTEKRGCQYRLRL